MLIRKIIHHGRQTVIQTVFLFVVSLFNLLEVNGQADTLNSTIKRNNLPLKIISSEIAFYGISMAAVGSAWYTKFEFKHWHWFDDTNEWFQIDKAGHAFATYQFAAQSFKIHKRFGFSNQQSLLWSTTSALIAVSSIEIFDGYAADWGASVSDLVANSLGAGLFLAQEAIWNNQYVKIKFSYHPTSLYKKRPELLGSNHFERLLKDYNAQQYWLSLNLDQIISTSFIPKWLNISVGYGAYNMISANTSDAAIYSENAPYRRFFFSPDIDMQKIKVRSKFLKVLMHAFNIIKVPLPTLELNKKGIKFHPLY